MNIDPIVIAGFARMPMAAFQGAFARVTAAHLGAAAVRAAVERAAVPANAIDRIDMGCVLPAGQGQAPARQVAIKAGLPLSVEATTVNKMCGSGMQATIMAAEALAAGAANIIVAGGMESMTNAPFLLAKHRSGARIGHDTIIDSMMMDGLGDAYDRGKPMGAFAEDSARHYQFSRAEQEEYALLSLSRAKNAVASHLFATELTQVTIPDRNGEIIVAEDEQPGKARPEKVPTLKPAFAKDGSITAATSASISDGAAALVLTRRSVAELHGLTQEAVIVASAAHAHEPAQFTTAPVHAIRKVLAKAEWTIADVDLFEVNEAFAIVPMIAERELSIPRQIEHQWRSNSAGPPDRSIRCQDHRDARRGPERARRPA